MIIKKKLRNVTPKDFEKWTKTNCCKTNCLECMFHKVICGINSCWVYNKDLYGDKFLNQEIEIETSDILDDVEKKYLSNIIKPFRNRLKSIIKYRANLNEEFIEIKVLAREYKDLILRYHFILLPSFKKGTMYKGMDANKSYTLEELGL